MKDIIGTPLAVGDTVVTDVMRYRSSALRVGTITQADERWIKVTYDLDGRKQSVNRKPEGVVKVAVNVQGTETPAAGQS